MLKKQKTPDTKGYLPSVGVLIPARNEERIIEASLKSVFACSYKGKLDVIVIDDASTDSTPKLVKKFPVNLIRSKKQQGKARSLNLGLKKTDAELIAVIDADSVISKDSITEAVKYFYSEDTMAVTSIIKVKNRKSFLGMWLHIEQLYNSLLRFFFSKINANISTPGPLSIYRKSEIEKIGGFSLKGYAEDIDIAIRSIKSGKKIYVSENSVAETNMPISFRGFIRQRTRFARGWIHILKKHLKLGFSMLDLYSMPLALFAYIQAVVMSLVIISQIASGYLQYFFSKGIIFNLDVANYFFTWFSLAGVINWIWTIISGKVALDFFTGISLLATLLSYPLYFIAILKYDKKIDIYHIIPILFMFPFWFMVMIIYLINLPEIFFGYRLNKWEKIN